VEKIAPLPDSTSRFMNPNLKVYNTIIAIDNPDPALRNGMSCRVEIFVQRFDDVLAVPVQAVTRVNGVPTVYVIENGQVVPRPVDIGLDNSRMVHVHEGLTGDEKVLLDPPLAKSDDVEDEDDQPSEEEKAAMDESERRGESSDRKDSSEQRKESSDDKDSAIRNKSSADRPRDGDRSSNRGSRESRD
jgi:hypothetical protein